MSAMEIEFKFCVAPERLDGLRSAVSAADATGTGDAGHPKAATRTRLQATYFDTPDARLASARAALRVRREGSTWVQTAKAIAQGPLVRLEDNVTLGPAQGDAVPAPDWRRHLGTPVGDLLAPLLGDAPLRTTYGTDITRLARHVQHGSAVVELALDEGRIHAGDAGSATACSVAVQELEIELVSGTATDLANLADLAAVAASWVSAHGLWLDTRSKAERGEQLLRGGAAFPVVTAAPLHELLAAGDGWQRQSRALQLGLAHLMPNLQALAAGQSEAAHRHQARVALRRLRGLLRHGAPLCATGWDPQGQWTQALTHALRQLGKPGQLHAAPSPAAAPHTLMAAARERALQLALVAMLMRAAQAAPGTAGTATGD